MQTRIKIIITEDKEKWRRVLRQELSTYNIDTIAEAENGIVLLEHLQMLTPDVILLDLAMPVMDGNETMRRLNEKHPDAKVIIMSLHDEPVLMEDYLKRGAKGFFSKADASGNINELATVIRKVSKGGKYQNFGAGDQQMKITTRQKEIINLIGAGKSQKEIANELGLTISGVEKQKRKIMDLFGAKNSSELYTNIFEKGLKYFRRHNRK